MLVPSGTMGNLAAMLTHCTRGTKAFLGSQAHTYVYEAGGAAALGSIVMTPIQNSPGGELDLDQLRDELDRPPDAHFAPPALVALENTHNLCAGAAVDLSHTAAVSELSHGHSLPLHLDGARIFNAALALEITAEDHLNARALAEGLSLIAGIEVRPVKRRTNMVVFDIAGNAQAAAAFAAGLKERGVLVGARGPTAFRAVTHYGTSRDDVNRAVAAASEAAAAAFAG
jgi:threonine aldolase